MPEPSLLETLKERKLVQWGLAYLAGAFAVFQLLDALAEPLRLSSLIQRAVLAVVALGFLITLVLAWYHGEKGRQRVSGPELLIIALLLFISGAVVSVLTPSPNQGPNTPSIRGSSDDSRPFIAVLPLANLSGREEDAWFTDGMHGQILTQLSRIGSLGVISGTSVQEYRGTPKNLREVGRELGAQYIAEGDVLRAGSQVRVNVQLIDAQTDDHVWANSYDRPLSVENLLRIQSEIAQAIAAALNAAVSPEVGGQTEAPPTENLQAYQYYVQGNDYRLRGYAREDMEIGILMHERAASLDSMFALAYAGLGAQHARFYHMHYDRSPERLEKARAAIARSFELDPDLPQAHFAQGLYHYYAELDYDQALREFSVAREAYPNDPDFSAFPGFVRRRQGRMEEALEEIRQAFELDPRRARRAFDLGETYRLNGDFAKAMEFYDRTITLAFDHEDAHVAKADLLLRCLGDVAGSERVLDGAPSTSETGVYSLTYQRVLTFLYTRRYEAALDLLHGTPKQIFENQFYFIPKALLQGQLHQLTGDLSEANTFFEEAVAELEARLQEDPSDPRFHGSLGIALAGQGRKDAALREAESAVNLLPPTTEVWRGSYRMADLVQVRLMIGDADGAVETLSELFSFPLYWWTPAWRLDPRFDSLQGHPGFRAFLEGHLDP